MALKNKFVDVINIVIGYLLKDILFLHYDSFTASQ